MRVLHCDVESRSTVDLGKANAYVYFDDPSTDLWLAAWAFDNDEPKLWFPGDPCPPEIVEHVEAGGLVAAWNCAFERLAWRKLLAPKYGWPELQLEQCRCVMAAALALALPAKLEHCAPALGLSQVKDTEGHALMLRMCRPRKARKGEDPAKVYWWDEPEKIARLARYCADDVRTETAIFDKIMPLPASEQAVWFLDQRANDLGVHVDEKLCLSGAAVVASASARLDEEMKRVTDYEVRGVSNVADLVAFCRKNGIPTDSVKKDELADLLVRDDLPPAVRRALEIRQEGSKTSTAKIKKLLLTRQRDGRMRGNLQYHGATTGRWAARGAQLQNLPRPAVKVNDALISTVLRGDADEIGMLYGRSFPPKENTPPISSMSVISDCVRSMVVAGPGKRLLAADYSQIEARMTAWMAGEEHVLDGFRAFDEGTGPDIYTVDAGGIYKVSPATIGKDDPRRQVGKVACIAEGQLVLTDSGEVPIEAVTLAHRVWDGVEFVQHSGIVYQGLREVITHDGLTATADHLVFTSPDRAVPFGLCADQQIRLVEAGSGGAAIWVGGGDLAGGSMAGEPRHARAPRGAAASEGPLLRLRNGEADRHAEPSPRQDERLPAVLTASARAEMAAEAGNGDALAVSEPQDGGVGALRGSRYRVQVPLGYGGRDVDSGASRAGQDARVGPGRQQRALRAGEPAVRDTVAELAQSSALEADAIRRGVGRDAEPARPPCDGALPPRGVSEGGHHRDRVQGGLGPAQELARHSRPARLARVYDILNAGPRHRFTVSGRLVHNCLSLGFGGGAIALLKMAKNYRLDIADAHDSVMGSATAANIEKAEEAWESRGKGSGVLKRRWLTAEVIKLGWRDSHPATVAYWKECNDAAIAAVENPGLIAEAGPLKYRKNGSWLFCRLPSGRCLAYAYPKVKLKDVPWLNADGTQAQRPALTFWAIDSFTKKWSEQNFYGGLAVQNPVQAAARDVMAEAMVRVERAGYPPVITIHDEVVAEADKDFGSLERFLELMRQPPKWTNSLPLAVEGWEGPRYRK